MRLRHGEIPQAWEAARRVLVEHLDGMRAVLDRGFRAREQYRDVRDVEIDTDGSGDITAVDVQVSGTAPPLAVLCLRATERDATSGRIGSGFVVAWSWEGGLVRVHQIASLSASTRYLVTLAVVD